MALRERAAARVLAGQAHQCALLDQRAERQELGERPVDVALAGHLATLLDDRLDARVHREALGHVDERVTDALEHRLVDGRGQARRRRLVQLHRLRRFGLELLELANLVEHPLELALVVAQGVFGFLHRDVAAADEGLGVALADAALGVDHVVHRRLGHRRVVALVVTATAVADHVDHDVLAELLTEVDGELRHPDTGCSLTIEFEGRETQAAESWRILRVAQGLEDRTELWRYSAFQSHHQVRIRFGATGV